MSAIQEIKETKLRYLAEVMIDMAEHIRKTTTERWIAAEIDEYAMQIREIVGISDGHLFAEKTLGIRRIESKKRLDYYQLYREENPDELVKILQADVVRNLLDVVRDLVKVEANNDVYGGKIINASLYVGVPPEKIKYIDKLYNVWTNTK